MLTSLWILLGVSIPNAWAVAQTANVYVDDTTSTQFFQMTNGVGVGLFLQSDAAGNASWMPIAGDDLGNHTATMDIDLSGNSVINGQSYGFNSGASFDDNNFGGLNFFGSQIDFFCSTFNNVGFMNMCAPISMNCNDIMFTNSMQFCSGTQIIDDFSGGISFTVPNSNITLNCANLLDVNSLYEFNQERFSDRHFTDGYTYGFLAQELQEVIPEAVRINSGGFHIVRYNAIIPVLAQAIQEIDKKVETLSPATVNNLLQENAQLKNDIQNLQAENEEMKAQLNQIQAMLENMNTNMQTCCLSAKTTESIELTPSDTKTYLMQNAPNPFYHKTLIQYYVPETAGSALLEINNMEGRVVFSEPIAQKGVGIYTLSGNKLTAGTYLYSLRIDGKVVATKEMILTK